MTAELKRLLALERYRNLAVIEATMKAEHDKARREQETMIMRHNLILHLQEENRRLHALNDELLATLKHIREKDQRTIEATKEFPAHCPH
jgi:hypothetical protein